MAKRTERPKPMPTKVEVNKGRYGKEVKLKK